MRPEERPEKEPPEGSPEAQRRRRRKWILPIAVAALLVLVAAGTYAALSSRNTGVTDALIDRTGQPAPAFSLPEVFAPNRALSLADFRDEPLVINFWASWCYPCQTEMPLLESAYRSDHGAVRFLGIDTDDTRPAAISFLTRLHITYPSLFMPERGPVAIAYSLIGLPVTVFVSPAGTELGRHVGQLNAATLSAALKLAFGSRVAH